MIKSLPHTIIKISIILGIVTVAFAVNYIQAAWSAPQNNPPDGNTPAPINAGTEAQVKEGALSVDGLTSYANTNIFIGANNQSLEIKPGSKGSVSTAGYTTLDVVGANGTLYTPKDLEVGGQVRAGQYCDENGENCSANLGGSLEVKILSNSFPGDGYYTIACPANYRALACSSYKKSSGNDSLTCRPNNSTCTFSVDKNSAFDGATGYCTCVSGASFN